MEQNREVLFFVSRRDDDGGFERSVIWIAGLPWVGDPPQEDKTEKPKEEENERYDRIMNACDEIAIVCNVPVPYLPMRLL